MLLPIQYRPKYIPGYESLYGVCRAGFVYSFNTWKFLVPVFATKKGYMQISLCKKGEKPKSYYIHRLVALVFIPNPNNLPEVNHKDENPSNNAVWNLEWCDRGYNCNYGTRNNRIGNKCKKVKCIETGEIFDSVIKASIWAGCTQSNISSCLRGRSKTAKKYHWEYEE